MGSDLNRLAFMSLLTCLASGIASAQSASTYQGLAYQEVRSTHERFLEDRPSLAARREAMREIVRASPYGERGLVNLFSNFDGDRSLDPRIDGVEKSVRLLTSASPQQRKGYARELLYGTSLHHDSRFKLEAMNQVRVRPWGNTDADLVATHRATGQRVRIEVKQVSLASQQRDLRKYLEQIDKMAAERVATGELQFWVNRREVLPAVQQYAAKRGVVAVGSVKTGANSSGVDFSDLLHRIHLDSLRSDRFMQATASAGLIYGGVLIAEGASELLLLSAGGKDGLALSDQERRLAIERALDVLSGASLIGYGGSYVVSRFTGNPAQGAVFRFGRASGAAGVVLLGASQATFAYRYMQGDISGRDFWTAGWVNAGASAGFWVFSRAGAAAGAMVPIPGASIGGNLLGGLGGGWLGKIAAERSANWYFERTQRQYEDEFGRALYAHYRQR